MSAIRRSDMVTRAVWMPARAQTPRSSSLGAGPERDASAASCAMHVVGQAVDDRRGRPISRRRASWKIRAESSRPMPTSCSACSCDHVPPKLSTSGGLGRHPVRLGVDEGAVHVPEDGGERGRIHRSMLPIAVGGTRGGRRVRGLAGGGTPRHRRAGISWKEPAGGWRRSRGRTGTTSARSRVRRMERRRRGRFVRDRAAAGQRRVRDACSPSTPSCTSTISTRARRSAIDGEGKRILRWPEATLLKPTRTTRGTQLWLLTGVEPARAWQAFAAEFIDVALREDITGLVALGSMMSDVPHTRPISVFAGSDSEQLRTSLAARAQHL